nr:GNAT family N-acetyltransferase [Lachnospiraceae bacterium]
TDGVAVWVPDYFCNQTVECFREEWMEFHYYPIDENLNPKWDVVREVAKTTPMDAFIFVHYFGKFHDISKAREISNLHGAVLIEDCAHVLYPHPLGKMGQYGDFAIYSQHKQLPISDGAVLRYNPEACKANTEELYGFVKQIHDSARVHADMNGWYQKKAIQKLTHLHKELPYSYGVHMGEKFADVYDILQISKRSYHILAGYSYEDYKRIAYIRRDNLRVMNAEITNRYPEIVVLNEADDMEAPYMGVYSLRNVESEERKKEIMEELLKEDFTILYWPDLPWQIEGEEGHEDALRLSKDLFVIPAIHQDVTPQELLKKFGTTLDAKAELQETQPASVDPLTENAVKNQVPLFLDEDGVTREDWERIYQEVRTTNIPQEWIYGDAKEATEGWQTRRFVIRTKKEEVVGVLQILVKKVAGLPVAVRVNRGPVLLAEYDCMENHITVMNELRKKIAHPIPILYMPFNVWSPKHLGALTKAGWKCRDPYAYPSGFLNLSASEEELNKGMKAFWRKHLKQARKQVEIRYNEYDATEIRRLYAEFLERRQIPGIPDHILEYLFNLEHPPLEVLTAHNEAGEMIAYKVLYVHGNTGTSFIAWNTDEGLQKQARTLLIFNSALRLKEMGCKYYDLGGIDDITTEAVARFKRGTGDVDYRLLGEFIKF